MDDMIGTVEASCTGACAAVSAGNVQDAAESGTETEELFAALLVALGYGLVSDQSEVHGALHTGQLALEGDVALEGTGAVGKAAPLSEGATAVWAANLTVAGASGSETSETVSVVNAASDAASDETVSSQLVPNLGENAGDQNTLSVHELEAPAKSDFFEEVGANFTPESRVQVNASSQPEPLSFVDAEAFGAVMSGSAEKPVDLQGDAHFVELGGPVKTEFTPSGFSLVRAQSELVSEESVLVGTQGEAQNGSVETESAPSGFTLTRAETEVVGEETALIRTRGETQESGDGLARDTGKRLFPANIVHSHGARSQQMANATDNNVLRVSDVGKAQLTQSVIDQTVKSVLLSARSGSSELRVRLKPDHLGELHLRLVFKDNVLHLDVNTQSTVVKSIMENNLTQLRLALDNSGVDVGRLSISVEPELFSGGHFSRETYPFQTPADEPNPAYREHHGEKESSLEERFRRARMPYVVSRIDLVA